MNKKAQTSRSDMAAWYGVSFVLVLVMVGGLYAFNLIGDVGEHGTLIGSGITGAVVTEIPEENIVLEEVVENNSTAFNKS